MYYTTEEVILMENPRILDKMLSNGLPEELRKYAIQDWVMPFGCCKGVPISQLDDYYLRQIHASNHMRTMYPSIWYSIQQLLRIKKIQGFSYTKECQI